MMSEIHARTLKPTVRAATGLPCCGQHSDGAHTLIITKQRAYIFIKHKTDTRQLSTYLITRGVTGLKHVLLQKALRRRPSSPQK